MDFGADIGDVGFDRGDIGFRRRVARSDDMSERRSRRIDRTGFSGSEAIAFPTARSGLWKGIGIAAPMEPGTPKSYRN